MKEYKEKDQLLSLEANNLHMTINPLQCGSATSNYRTGPSGTNPHQYKRSPKKGDPACRRRQNLNDKSIIAIVS